MTFYHPLTLLGMVVSENGAAEICVDVTGNVEKTYVWFDCLEIIQWILSQMGASSIQYTATSLVPTSIRQLPRPHTRAGDIFSTTTPNCRLVTAAHEHVTQSRLRYLSTVVNCPSLRLFVSPSRSRQNRDARLLRPDRARVIDVRRSFSAVQPRHVSPLTWATSFTAQFELSHLSVRALQFEQPIIRSTAPNSAALDTYTD